MSSAIEARDFALSEQRLAHVAELLAVSALAHAEAAGAPGEIVGAAERLVRDRARWRRRLEAA